MPTLAAITRATVLSAGGDHPCAGTLTGHLECWGGGTLGQLGNAMNVNASSPVRVAGL